MTYGWETASAAWVGWVPTVSGHLSFSLIGQLADGKFHAAANGEQTARASRVVVVRQRRRTEDFGYSAWLAELLLKDTVQDFILVAITQPAARPAISSDRQHVDPIPDRRGSLCGSIYTFPYQEDHEGRGRVKHTLQSLNKTLDTVSGSHGRTSEKYYDSLEKNVRSLLDPIAAENIGDNLSNASRAIKFEFALFRTGEFRIWIMDPPVSADAINTAAKQAFYFVKSIAHAHGHHEAESDQIVHLARFHSTGGQDKHDFETNWRNETQWGLSRVFEQLHRHQSIGAQKRALGVLAYADAFQGALAQIMRLPGNGEKFAVDKNIALYDNQHRRESARALIDYRTHKTGENSQIFVLIITTLLASIGLWYGFVSIRGVLCAGENGCMPLQVNRSAFFVSVIINSPLTFALSSVIFVYVAFSSTIKDIDKPILLFKTQSVVLRPLFAVLSTFIKKSRYLVLCVEVFIIVMMVASVLAVRWLIQNQIQIRNFTNSLDWQPILDWLP